MYEALHSVADDLRNLKVILASPTEQAQVAHVVTAFEAAAQQLSEVAQRTDSAEDHAALQTLYRGFLATSRIIQQLQELYMRAAY